MRNFRLLEMAFSTTIIKTPADGLCIFKILHKFSKEFKWGGCVLFGCIFGVIVFAQMSFFSPDSFFFLANDIKSSNIATFMFPSWDKCPHNDMMVLLPYFTVGMVWKHDLPNYWQRNLFCFVVSAYIFPKRFLGHSVEQDKATRDNEMRWV